MRKDILDHGYVELIEARGTDRFMAQTARTSTSTEAGEDADNRLLTRLIKDEHTSPIEFASVVFYFVTTLGIFSGKVGFYIHKEAFLSISHHFAP